MSHSITAAAGMKRERGCSSCGTTMHQNDDTPLASELATVRIAFSAQVLQRERSCSCCSMSATAEELLA